MPSSPTDVRNRSVPWASDCHQVYLKMGKSVLIRKAEKKWGPWSAPQLEGAAAVVVVAAVVVAAALAQVLVLVLVVVNIRVLKVTKIVKFESIK